MRPDDDDFAAIVVAQSFQLVDSAGNDIADLGVVLAQPALKFNHNTTEASYLRWTREAVGLGHELRIETPAAGTTLQLYEDQGTPTRHVSLAVATGGSLYLAGGTVAAREASIFSPGIANMQSGSDVFGVPQSGALSLDSRKDNLTAWANSSGTGAGTLELKATGTAVNIAAPTVNLKPSTGLQLNSRSARAVTDALQLDMTNGASVGLPGVSSFLFGNLDFTAVNGDRIMVEIAARLDITVVGGSTVLLLGYFAPGAGAATLQPARMVHSNSFVGQIYLSRQWIISVVGSGLVHFQIYGFTNGGAVALTGGDTSMSGIVMSTT